MPTLSFEGETHGELVVKVRRWLASLEGEEEGHLSRAEAVHQGAELTKEALRIIASAAPQPIAQSEVVKALTGMGYFWPVWPIAGWGISFVAPGSLRGPCRRRFSNQGSSTARWPSSAAVGPGSGERLP